MGTQVKIKIELSKTDLFMEVFGFVALISLWIMVGLNYSHLTDSIPTHFNISGKPDSFGNKHNFLVGPIIGTLLFFGLTVLNKYPHIFNYPVKITSENAKMQYTFATRLIRALKLGIIAVFSLVSIKILSVDSGNSDGLGIGFIPLIIGIYFIPIGYYVYKMIKSNSELKK